MSLSKIKDKAVVIGIDGASFNLIQPWLDDGELPALKTIMNKGVYAWSKSCYPPVTCPNWKCYSTGKNPGKLGIFWWTNFDRTKKDLYLPRDRLFINKEIWDYIGNAGGKVIVVNMPLTYPPKKVNGILISGAPDGLNTRFTYPRKLELFLKKEFRYKVNPSDLHLVREHDENAISNILDLIKIRFEVARTLLEMNRDVSFLHLTIFYINTLHHYLWDGYHVKEAWKIIDHYIGVFIKEYPDFNFFIISDHGSSKINSVFNVNAWLEKEGYLNKKLIIHVQKIFEKIKLNRENVLKYMTYLGLIRVARMLSNTRIGRFLESTLSLLPSYESIGNLKEIIKWDNTLAVALPQGLIYLLNPIENRVLINKIKRKLLGIVDPITGKHPIKRVYSKYEVYSGSFLAEAPDIIIEYNDGFHLSANISESKIFSRPSIWLAENAHRGIFLAYGPSIKGKGYLGYNVSILDVAPTILHIMGLKVPQDMDGRIIRDIIYER